MSELAFLLYIVLFLSYFIIHSIFASLFFKNWFYTKFPRVKPYYRLLFNIISVILFVPLIILMMVYPGETLWQWTSWQAWVANTIALLAIIGFYISLSDYDMADFFGLYPFKEKSIQNISDSLFIGRFHLHIRHPWYFFLLLLIWTRDMTTYQLLVAVLSSLYLIIGSYLEEKKMLISFGQCYRDYQNKVPGLIPLPWKYMTRTEADLLLQQLKLKN